MANTRKEELGRCQACGALAAACRKAVGMCCAKCEHHNLVVLPPVLCECCERQPRAAGHDYCEGCMLDGGKS